MKRTPFYDQHVALGAKFVNFGGWELPVQFRGIQSEHLAVRHNVGLFDVSHMGEIEVRGSGALDAVNRLITNDLAVLIDGQACYTAMCNEHGGIIDDFVVYRFNTERIFICCNASNREKDFAWIQTNIVGPQVLDRGDEFAQLALQGPNSEALLQRLTATPLAGIDFYHFAVGRVADVETIISRTGYTGETGFELYIPKEKGPRIWQALMDASAGELAPCGLGARNTLRLEMKFCSYGNDIDDSTSPLEAGLDWVVKMKKPGGFIGREAIATQKAQGLKRRLVAFVMDGPAIARHDCAIVDESGTEIGKVTSGTCSPLLNKSIGLAYVPDGMHNIGSKIRVQIRGRMEMATIIKPPFVTPDSAV